MPCAWSRECWFLRLANATCFVCSSEPKYWTNTNKQKAVDPCRQWNVTRFDRGHHCQKKDRKLDTHPMVSTSSVPTIIAYHSLGPPDFPGSKHLYGMVLHKKAQHLRVSPPLIMSMGPAISKSSGIEYVQEWGCCSLQPLQPPLAMLGQGHLHQKAEECAPYSRVFMIRIICSTPGVAFPRSFCVSWSRWDDARRISIPRYFGYVLISMF